jgi:NAD(P)-dependent dehydrogenase (short-subunit alcohol dehydrogenase family)
MAELGFDGKVAIITGAGGGLGRSHALELARRGALIVVNDLGGSVDGTGSGTTAAQAVVDEIAADGGEAVANYDSVATPEGGRSIVQTAIDSWGRVDIIINNAGILRDTSFKNMTPDQLNPVLDVHLRGAFYVTQPAWQIMRDQNYGRIVNTSSGAGIFGNFGQTNYGAAKAGIAAMTIIASLELTRYGVRANCIGPGGFTRMVGQARQDITIKNPEEYTEFDGMNPGNSAPAVAWLASDDSKPTTGQVLRMVGNSLCVYQPWQMGEEFFATDTEGKPARWDAADVGNILNKYVFHTVNPGIAAQQKR